MTHYVFVVGTGRCGSSLLQELLCRHRGVGFVSNVDDLSPRRLLGTHNHAVYRRVPPRLTEKGRGRFAPSEAWRALAREVSPLVVDPRRDLVAADATPWLADRFRRFFLDRAAAQRQPVFIHKFTGWPRIGLIRAVFPDARFVHVVRDGRAVANSWLQMPWWRGHLGPDGWHFGPLPERYAAEWQASAQSFVLLAGLAWKLLLDAFEQAAASVPASRVIQVRFEDLVSDPEVVLEEVLQFAGLPPDDDFRRQVARYDLSAGRQPRQADLLGRDGLALLDRSLAEHLSRYHYPVGDSNRRP